MKKEKKSQDPRWTIAELQKQAERALAVGYGGIDNGQIRSIPNERALRYYTTIGLLDRPVEMRGRTGYYGWRHLLQVVAVKRLQAQGLSLVDVQQRLAGRPIEALAAMAELPEHASALPAAESAPPSTIEPPPQQEQLSRRRQAFWRTNVEDSHVRETTPKGLQSMQLATDLMLLWTGQAANDTDLESLRQAAKPLVEELTRRGLLTNPGTEQGGER